MDLNRGINLGGFLSQCDHTWEHYRTFIQKKDILEIKKQGFDHVRLPIDYMVLEDEFGTSLEEGYDLVYQIVDWCMSAKLNIILDLHKAYGYDFNDAGNKEQNNLFDNTELQERFIRLWKNIASHFHGYSHVTFELLNEVVEKDNVDAWNSLIERTVAAIREIAPTAPIIYGGIQWNSASTLKFLKKPEDENTIFTFHFYEPLLFTHQKAYWVPNMDMESDIPYPAPKAAYLETCRKIGEQGDAVANADFEMIDKEFMRSMMQEAIEAAAKNGVKLYCGEFGVIDRAPVEDTLRWFEDVMSLFDEYKIGSAVWTYKEKDFGVSGEHYAPICDRLYELLTI